MSNIIVIGCSGHARAVIDAVEREDKFRIAGIIDTFEPVGHGCLGYSVLGDEFHLPALIREFDICGGIIAVGDNWLRCELAGRVCSSAPGFRFVTVIHPSAQVARTVRLGPGTVILAGAIVSSAAEIGEFCILNTNASLGHDGVMGVFSSLAPSATTGGGVTIKPFSAVMLGANIVHAVTIGQHSVVGAGSLVLRDIPDHVVAYGSPARVIRSRNPGDPYLRVQSRSEPCGEPAAIHE